MLLSSLSLLYFSIHKSFSLYDVPQKRPRLAAEDEVNWKTEIIKS